MWLFLWFLFFVTFNMYFKLQSPGPRTRVPGDFDLELVSCFQQVFPLLFSRYRIAASAKRHIQVCLFKALFLQNCKHSWNLRNDPQTVPIYKGYNSVLLGIFLLQPIKVQSLCPDSSLAVLFRPHLHHTVPHLNGVVSHVIKCCYYFHVLPDLFSPLLGVYSM